MRSLLIALVAFVAGYGLAATTDTRPVEQAARAIAQGEQPQQVADNGRSSGREVFVVDQRGHVETHAGIDGRDMPVLVDTGASAVILRESAARRAGYSFQNADFTVPVNTANGQTHFAAITLREVELGSIRVRNVQALVGRDDELGTNLLGMSFLGRLDSFRFEGRELILEN
ncbi:MAG: TIGR02281 family clan AA aspartic protease [Hyphomicrobiales bacterium]